MIDWSTCLIEADSRHLESDRILRISPDGETRWETEASIDIPSWDTSFRIRRTRPQPGMVKFTQNLGRSCPDFVLFVSGNPVKWIQGHNVFGPSPVHHVPLLRRVLANLDRGLDLPDHLPAVHRSRMDITLSFRLGEDCQAVHDWLHSAALLSRSRHGTAIRRGETVYWNTGSRRWVMKAYCKACELEAHKPRPPRYHDLPNPADIWLPRQHKVLHQYAKGLLRLELTLKGQELRQYGTIDNDMFWCYWSKLTMSKQTKTMDMMADNLKRPTQNTYFQWISGREMKKRLLERTYYRHRKEILKVVGVDISVPYNSDVADDNQEDKFSEQHLKIKQESDHPPEEVLNKTFSLNKNLDLELPLYISGKNSCLQ